MIISVVVLIYRAEAFEEQRKKELVKKAQSDACDRVNESRKKVCLNFTFLIQMCAVS